MEERKSIFATLNTIEFDDWVNIPGPLVQAFIVFKQCFSEHSRRISDLYLEMDKMTEKVQFKIRSLNEVIANTNELIQNQQETVLKKVKERGEFLRNDMLALKNKISEENSFKQKVMNESLRVIEEKVERSIKIVNSALKPEEVHKIITDKTEALHVSICSEVKDQILKPITEKLVFDIRQVNDKYSKSLETTNQLIKNLEKKIYEESQNFFYSHNELVTEQAKISNLLAKGLKDKTKEVEDLNKKIVSCQDKYFDLQSNFNQSLQNHTKETESLAKSIRQVSEQFSKIESKQQVFTHTSVVTNTVHSTKEVPIYPEINISKILEPELNSLKAQIENSVKVLKSEINKKIFNEVGILEEKMSASRLKLEQAYAEIKDKLNWLPINLSELKGMSPNDARLFTIEARLRAEENSRIQAFSSIEKSIETLRKHSASPLQTKISERRTPDLKYSRERLVKITEPAKDRNFSTIMDGHIFDTYDMKRIKCRKSRSKIVSG